jgi:anaerobic ribonucleoside-triphosphate reductase
MGKKELLDKYKNERTPVEVWSRVMGYMRNVKSFNQGKKSEFKQRVFFEIKTLEF